MSTLARLLARVDVDDETGCWTWTGAVQTKGYGTLWVGGRSQLAHRVSYELHRPGYVLGVLTLDHLCHNTRCVNPDHLDPVTRSENRARQNEDRDSCKRGHPLRTRRRGNGFSRHCPICEPYARRTPGDIDVPLFDLGDL